MVFGRQLAVRVYSKQGTYRFLGRDYKNFLNKLKSLAGKLNILRNSCIKLKFLWSFNLIFLRSVNFKIMEENHHFSKINSDKLA